MKCSAEMGRTGNMFAWQGFGVKPDILTMAKAIGKRNSGRCICNDRRSGKHSLQPEITAQHGNLTGMYSC